MPERSWVVIPNMVWTPRTVVSTGFPIDDDITHLSITVDRTDWDELHPDPLISFQLWRSEDGGATWLDAGASGAHGGPLKSDEGVEWAASTWTFGLPAATNRQLKFEFTVYRTTRLSLGLDAIIKATG